VLENIKLKGKILIQLLIPMILILSALGMYAYYNARNSLNDQIQQTLNWMTNDNSNRIHAELQNKASLVDNMAQMIGNQFVTKEQMLAFLQAVKQSNPGVTNVFVGFEDKSYLESNGAIPKEGYDPRTRSWYAKAVASEGVIYSEVYVDEGTKQPTVSIARKIMRNGNLLGVAAIDLSISDYQAMVKAITFGKTGYAFVLDEKGNFLSDPSLTLADNIMQTHNGQLAEIGKLFLSGKPVSTTLTYEGVEKLYVSAPIGQSGWCFVVTVPLEEMFDSVHTLGKVSLLASIIGLLILTGTIFFVANRIVWPIQSLSKVVSSMAQGDLSVETEGMAAYASRDEIGDLIRNLHDMKMQFGNLVKQVAVSAEHVAASSEQLTASAEQSAQVSTQVAQSITEVAQGAENQLAATDKVMDAVERRAAAIDQVAVKAESMAETSQQAAGKAEQGKRKVEKAVGQMSTLENTVIQSATVVSKLGERSKEIGQIVEAISGIAAQTNLLALNAAIEAARAGEQGRGFAVVAEEVRKLAEQSGVAAKQIEELIVAIQKDTAQAVMSMENGTREVKIGGTDVRESGAIFEEILTMVHNVSQQVQDISASVQELSAGGQEIVSVMDELDHIGKEMSMQTQTVSAATEESSATAEEIASSSQVLAKMAQDLHTEISKFTL
jgi:methyl-accepting chemotaxis protein